MLKVLVKPGLDEVSRHMISHTPFASWCQDCVAGRSRGIPHKAILDKKMKEFEIDYTFYSEEGFNVTKENQQRAQAVVTMVHKATSAVASTVVL